MKCNILLFLIFCAFLFSCASAKKGPQNVDEVVDISSINNREKITPENAESILQKYIVDFEIPNPLYGEPSGRSRKIDPSHEATINCKAALLDDYSTNAHILYLCSADSLDDGESEKYRKDYIEKNLREGMFRIFIEMESGFSPKSMEPEHWAIYLENSNGVMIEPFDKVASTVTTVKDSVYSQYYDTHLDRNLLKRDITLYFKNKTFFGETLLGGENQFIVLVMSRKKKTVARVAWKFLERE